MKQKNLALIAAGVAVAVIAFAGAAAVLGNDSETELKARHYEIGRLDDSTGKFDEDDNSGIVTKDFYKFEELKSIAIEKDVVYYVNAYDADKTFIQVDEFTEDWTKEDATTYEGIGAVYFKLEVVDEDNDDLSFLDRYSLAGKIEVTLEEVEEE